MSKVISANDHAAVQRWQAPSVVNQPGQSTARAEKMPTAQEIEEIRELARQEGYDSGLRQGLLDGHAEISLQAEKFMQLCDTLAEPLTQLDDSVEQQLVALAFAIARQIIRREIKTDPGHIVAAVREAIGQLPIATRTVRLYLHPDDAVIVRTTLSISDTQQRWEIVEDPVVTRGGCRVVTESSQIDATVEKRLAAAAAVLLGGEREQDGIESNSNAVANQDL